MTEHRQAEKMQLLNNIQIAQIKPPKSHVRKKSFNKIILRVKVILIKETI